MIEKDGKIQYEKDFSSIASVTGCPPVMSDAEVKNHWYVMRSTYSREIKAKEMLNADGVVCYVPMKRMRTESGDKMVPAVHNLVFVHTNRKFMDKWKRKHEEECPLRYAMDRTTSSPMIVCDKEMEDFILVTRDSNEEIIYLDNPNVVVEKGKQIEIVCGQYTGVRGIVLRILRDRKVVVSVNGLVSVALSGIPFSWMKEV